MTRQTATQQRTLTPSPLSTGSILQRKCGSCSQHTIAGGTCAECGKKKSGLQRKLTIGASNDPLEREADRIAEQVLAAPAPTDVNAAPLRIQRLAGQPTGEADMAAPASVDRVLSSHGSPMEPSLQQDMEQRFGHDFSQVRVHTDGAAGRSARDVNANAYTVGHNIVFGKGRYAPGTHEGRRLIAHELTHVVQQSGADETHSGQGNENRALSPIFPQSPDRQSASLQINHYLGTPSGIIFRSESVHPEEQHCEDISKDSTASCLAIIDCIQGLIELLAGRFADIENKGGDKGHQTRIKNVQKILKTLITMALSTCKQGEFDEELATEAKKWANKPVQRTVLAEEPSFREKIANALKKAGIPPWALAALIVLIIAALADPEPFSKVALIIGTAAAIVVFGAIGLLSYVPSSNAKTASSGFDNSANLPSNLPPSDQDADKEQVA